LIVPRFREVRAAGDSGDGAREIAEGASGFGMGQATEQVHRVVGGHRLEEARVGPFDGGDRQCSTVSFRAAALAW
jgi:hypothetical protein